MKNIFKFIFYRIILYSWVFIVISPILWVVFHSFKTNFEFFSSIWSLPKSISFDNYINAWERYNLKDAFLNTAYFVLGSLVISIVLTSLNAYGLTRIKFKGRQIIISMIWLSAFLPGINAIVPQYTVIRRLGLLNSLTGLIILYSVGESIFSLAILGGFMKSIPYEIEESAFIDGASHWQVFWKIIVPLSAPGIATIAIFRFLNLYNAFLEPFIYLTDPKKYTIGVQMYQANKIMQYSSDWVTLFAGVIIAMLPSIIIFIIFQKWVIKGATMGSIK